MELSVDMEVVRRCLAGEAEALRRFDALLAEAARVLERRVPDAARREDILQDVRGKLLVAEAGATPKLKQFGGESTLVSWLRTVLVRESLSHLRGRGPKQGELSELVESLPARGLSPELDFVRRSHRVVFTEAFTRALEGLEPRERSVLWLSFVEGLSIDQLGVLYGVHRTTAARWVVRARERLVEGTRAWLSTVHRLDTQDIDELLASLQSHLGVSLLSLLRMEEPEVT
ncbi:MAG: sigma-70 family RNA polymerase sigma factor [Myxococcaceae bacterium]|nr:sigma-70 family RNA polymerase sigma factor [Myxococcaceae bacterium]